MSLRKNLIPLDASRGVGRAPALSTFCYRIVGTRPDLDASVGLFSAFLKDSDTPGANFGARAADFAYEKFQLFARGVAGHESADKWLAEVGDDVFAVTRENEWHHALHCVLRRELLDRRDRPNNAAHITFTTFPEAQDPQRQRGIKRVFDAISGGPTDVTLPLTQPPGVTQNTSLPPTQPPGVGRSVVGRVKDASTARGLYTRDALRGVSLDAVARYFGVTVDALTHRHGLTLPGTKQPLRLDQSLFVYQFLHECGRGPSEMTGKVLADGTGMGKTRSSLALLAEVRMIEINAEHIADHPEQHLRPGGGGTVCPSARWRGSECACVEGSIRHRWASKLVGGPFLAFVPTTITLQWEFDADSYFYRFIDDQGSGHDASGAGFTAFVDPYVWDEAQFRRAGDDAAMERPAHHRLIADITGQLSICSKDREFHEGITDEERQQLQSAASNGRKGYNKLLLSEDFRARVSPRPPTGPVARVRASPKLLIVAANVFGPITSKLAITTEISAAVPRRNDPGSSGRLTAQFGVPPTLVLLDESHASAPSTVIWSRLQGVLQFTESQRVGGGPACKPFWLFISATPLATGPSSVFHLLPYLYRQKAMADSVIELLGEYEGRGSGLLTEAHEDPNRTSLPGRIARLASAIERCIAPFMVTRREGTPMGGGRAVRAYSGETSREDILIPLEGPDLAAVQRVGSAWRQRGFPGLGGKKIDGLARRPEFLAYASAALMPGLAAASEACGEARYPFAVDAIRRDVKDGAAGLVVGNVGRHDGSRWLQEITRIIGLAHSDRGADGSEPRKHVLVVTALPGIAEHLYVVLKNNGALAPSVTVTLLSGEEQPRNRLRRITGLQRAAAGDGDRIQVVVSAAGIVGTGVDGLSLCSYLIIFGDLHEPAHLQQVEGRVARTGQLYNTRVYRLHVQHDTQELVRQSLQNPGKELSTLGLFTA